MLMDYDSGRVLAESERRPARRARQHHQGDDRVRGFRCAQAKAPKLDRRWCPSARTRGARARIPPSRACSCEVGKTARSSDLLRHRHSVRATMRPWRWPRILGGTEDGFAQIMNHYAEQLGMKNTHYADASGMPEPTALHTRARHRDAVARADPRFPRGVQDVRRARIHYHGIRQQNRNGLLGRDPSVDGIKTGHTETAGYCLAASAKRDDMRLISVVMGTPSIKAREDASAALLGYGFTFYETVKVKSAATGAQAARVTSRRGDGGHRPPRTTSASPWRAAKRRGCSRPRPT